LLKATPLRAKVPQPSRFSQRWLQAESDDLRPCANLDRDADISPTCRHPTRRSDDGVPGEISGDRGLSKKTRLLVATARSQQNGAAEP
jgi:hypothetical protein